MHSKIEALASVQSLLTAEPFRPFEIATTGGKTFTVPHPDYIQVSIMGSRVYIDGADGSLAIVHASQISHVATKTRKRKAA
jgi:hypothetical protein